MPRRFRPRKGPTIVAFVLLCVLLSLGLWQVKRLAWKTDLLATLHARLEAASVPLPEKIEKPDDWEYRKVTVAGTYLHNHEFLIGPRTKDGQAGFHMFTPLKRASGGLVFINRGWISQELLKKTERPIGLVPVEGLVRLPKKPAFAPANNPPKNQWYWPDLPAMARTAGIESPLSVVIDAAPGEKGAWPIGGQTRLDIPNDHRQYAAFWFGMALVLSVIWFISSRTENGA
jgi:surfeit locus 1 family protein